MPNDSCSVPLVPLVTDGSFTVLFYGRYSSDNQREASIEDQFRECRRLAESKGWTVLEHLNQSDEEKTGRTRFNRSGLDAVLTIVKAKPRIVHCVVIADTSRFGRNAAETLQLANIFRFHGVVLYFVEDGLDSREPSFWDNFTRKAIEDERYSRSLGAKVKRGRLGRFLAGYNPGGGCYGYRNVPDYDYTRKGSYGQPFVIGVKQEIDPVTSAIVLRIFTSYAEGRSYRDIAVMLNNEGIPTSQGPRSKRKSSWSKNAIHSMLENTRYIGQVYCNTCFEELDPETGKRLKRSVPREKWEFREAPELQIIPTGLWEKVQQKRKERARIGVQKSGGMNRTEASRRYLLSGLMDCGLCGGSIVVVTSGPTKYGCANHRYRGDCSNRFMIRQDQLEQAFLVALSKKLGSEELHEELIRAVHAHLQSAKNQQTATARTIEAQRAELEANRAELVRQQANLLKAIKDWGGRRSMAEELDDLDARIGRIDDLLATSVQPAPPAITLDEVRKFVDSQSDSFKELLLGSPERLKSEFQKRVKAITVTPAIDERGLVFKVTGDVDLFSLSEDVMQSNPVELIGLHYTIPISCQVERYKYVRYKAPRDFAPSAQQVAGSSDMEPVMNYQVPARDCLEDDLLATAQQIDTDALLRSVYVLRDSLKPKWPTEPAEDGKVSLACPHIYRDGFGGLRLAALEPESAADRLAA